MSTEQAPLPARPSPETSPESAAYWEATGRGELLVGGCEACGARHHPPQAVCPACWSLPTTATPSAGRGVVEAVSVVHRHAHPAFKARVPYAVAWIRLDEGPALLSTVVADDPDEVQIGSRVTVDFDTTADGVAVPVFGLVR